MKICSIESCNNKVHAKGLCNKHYRKFLKENKIEVCKIFNCTNKIYSKDLCEKHYKQKYRHGAVLERTIYDLNEIVKYDDYAEMILYDKNNKETARTIIDLESIELINKYKWYLTDQNYVNNNEIGRLHRYILDVPNNMVVDHINHNTLDNRKENLRICTQEENTWNSTIRSDNTSGHTGVKPLGKKWYAEIRVNNKYISLGSFKTYEEAVNARQQAEIDYFGDFAPHLNDKE